MRFLFPLFALLFFASTWTNAEEDPNYLYSLSFQGGMTTTRYAKPEFAESLRRARPDGVSINWNFSSSEETAEAEAKQETETINRVVAEVLNSQPEAVLALVSIRGTKQGVWAFYTSDGPRLLSALQEGLQGKTKTPLRIRTGKDPEWKAFNSFLSRLSDQK